MAAAKKDFLQCSHCGRKMNDGKDEQGYDYIISAHGTHRISCPCGVMTRSCPTKNHLQAVWNSRPNKIVLPIKIDLKQSLTQHVDPADIDKLKPKTDPEPF